MIRFRALTWAERSELREERLSSWHKWFAWRPIRLSSNKHEVRWLGFIYRKGEYCYYDDGSYWKWKYAETEFDILRMDENNNEE
jgi:hypothetical protein